MPSAKCPATRYQSIAISSEPSTSVKGITADEMTNKKNDEVRVCSVRDVSCSEQEHRRSGAKLPEYSDSTSGTVPTSWRADEKLSR